MSLRHSPRPHCSSPETESNPCVHSSIAWLWHILYIVYCLEVGAFLLFLPWMGIWENNYLLYRYPEIRPIVANSFLKGGVLGLGIVNLLIGIQEVARFKRNYFSR